MNIFYIKDTINFRVIYLVRGFASPVPSTPLGPTTPPYQKSISSIKVTVGLDPHNINYEYDVVFRCMSRRSPGNYQSFKIIFQLVCIRATNYIQLCFYEQNNRRSLAVHLSQTRFL